MTSMKKPRRPPYIYCITLIFRWIICHQCRVVFLCLLSLRLVSVLFISSSLHLHVNNFTATLHYLTCVLCAKFRSGKSVGCLCVCQHNIMRYVYTVWTVASWHIRCWRKSIPSSKKVGSKVPRRSQAEEMKSFCLEPCQWQMCLVHVRVL